MRWGRHAAHTLTLAVVLASQAGDSSCQDMGAPGYSCHVTAGDPHVGDDGRVTASVRNVCDPGLGPQYQTFMTWIETRRNPADDWLVSSRVGIERRPPPAGGDTYRLRDGRCQADVEYGTAWHASGDDHKGVAFDTGVKRSLFGTTGLC